MRVASILEAPGKVLSVASEFKTVRMRKQARGLNVGAPALMVLTSAGLAVASVVMHSSDLFLLCIFVLMAAPIVALMVCEMEPLDELLLWLLFFW